MLLATLLASILIVFTSDVNAGGWPINPSNSMHAIFSTYGQLNTYVSNKGVTGFYFHDGIDIQGPAGTNVYWRESAQGKVTRIFPTNHAEIQPGDEKYEYCQIGFQIVGSDNGWSYVHLKGGYIGEGTEKTYYLRNPLKDLPWETGDIIEPSEGDSARIGEIVFWKFDPGWEHVHLMWGIYDDSNSYTVKGNPLSHLSPVNDNVHPVVEDVKYRKAEDV